MYSFFVRIINEKRNDLTRQRLTCYIYRHILPSNHIFLLLNRRKKTKWKTERAGVVISRVHPKTQNAISSFYFICEKIYSTFCPFRLCIRIHTFPTAHRFFLTLSRSLLFGICGACFLFRFAFYFVLNIDFDITEITFFQDHKSSRIKWALSTFSRCSSQENLIQNSNCVPWILWNFCHDLNKQSRHPLLFGNCFISQIQ